MQSSLRASLLGFPGLVIACLAGCSSSSDNPRVADTGTTDGAGADVAADASTGPTLAAPCADSIESIYGDPGPLPAAKGALIKCARDAHLAMPDLQAKLDAAGYKGAKATSGAFTYRVVFRSTRGDGKSTPAATSAVVMLPDAPRAAAMPLTIVSRGSRGQGPLCAASKHDPAAASVNPDLDALELQLVVNGFPIIVPDGPGIVNAGPSVPPPAYFSATDLGQSLLDGAGALRAMLPAQALTDKVLIVGLSEGAANALSALAISGTYGVSGTIAGVVGYSPIWFSQRAWGAELFVADTYPSATQPAASAIVLWYNYTHAELIDGPGAGRKLFVPAKADAAESYARTRCWGQWDDVIALGHDTTSFFDPAFVNAVGAPAAVGSACDAAEPAHSLCTTWLARYDADRPHLTGAAASTPILALFGLKDTFLGQDRFQCVVDRLATDKATVRYCLDKGADHGGITRSQGDYVVHWLAARGLGEPEPAKCALDETANVDAAGKPVPCASLPPNTP
ncbi:MAG: hypothetical protein NVSMB47_11570 [Polyangiales bacterium]